MEPEVILVGLERPDRASTSPTNVLLAVEYFPQPGGKVGRRGGPRLLNKADPSGEAQAFAKAVSIPILAPRSPRG